MRRRKFESYFIVSSYIRGCKKKSLSGSSALLPNGLFIFPPPPTSPLTRFLALSSSSVLLVARFLIKGDSVGAYTSIACPYYSTLKALHSPSSLECSVPYFISLHHQTKNGTKFLHMVFFFKLSSFLRIVLPWWYSVCYNAQQHCTTVQKPPLLLSAYNCWCLPSQIWGIQAAKAVLTLYGS